MITLEGVTFSFEITSVPILMADSEGVIAYANSEFEKLFQYNHGELQGKPVECLVPPLHRQRHPEFVAAFKRVPAKRSMGQALHMMAPALR